MLGFDFDSVQLWGSSGPDSRLLEGLDGAFGQIVVVEISVIFVSSVLAIWSFILKFGVGGGAEESPARIQNIQDAVNAGAVLAWLLVVGLSLSAMFEAWKADQQMLSLLSDSANFENRELFDVTWKEFLWRMTSKT